MKLRNFPNIEKRLREQGALEEDEVIVKKEDGQTYNLDTRPLGMDVYSWALAMNTVKFNEVNSHIPCVRVGYLSLGDVVFFKGEESLSKELATPMVVSELSEEHAVCTYFRNDISMRRIFHRSEYPIATLIKAEDSVFKDSWNKKGNNIIRLSEENFPTAGETKGTLDMIDKTLQSQYEDQYAIKQNITFLKGMKIIISAKPNEELSEPDLSKMTSDELKAWIMDSPEDPMRQKVYNSLGDINETDRIGATISLMQLYSLLSKGLHPFAQMSLTPQIRNRIKIVDFYLNNEPEITYQKTEENFKGYRTCEESDEEGERLYSNKPIDYLIELLKQKISDIDPLFRYVNRHIEFSISSHHSALIIKTASDIHKPNK